MKKHTTDFTGKVAVVTGGAGVLCSLFAKVYAAYGAKVAVVDLAEEKARQIAAEIVAEGGDAIAVAANVLQKQSLEAARDAVVAHYGRIDILLNGAGGNHPRGTTEDEQYDRAAKDVRDFFALDKDGLQFVFDLNIMGTVLTSQVFASELLKQEGSCVINMSSMSAFCPLTKTPAYSLAKAGVSNFTQWLAVYFAKAGIRVNALAPGFFSTQQNAALLWNPDGTPTARSGKILAGTPMDRFGVPEDLVGGLLYLSDSEMSAFVTGIVLPIDGGYAAYSGV